MDPTEYDKISLLIEMKRKYDIKLFRNHDDIEKNRIDYTLLLKTEKDKIKKRYLKK